MQTLSATVKLPDGSTHTEAYAYNDDGQTVAVAEDGNTIATSTYTTGVLTAVAYPGGTSNAGNGTSGTFGYTPTGAQTSVAWAFAAGQTPVSDTVARSQAGRIVQDTIADGPTSYVSTYGYDTVGRLVTASVPYNQLTYGYAASGGCGANTAHRRPAGYRERALQPAHLRVRRKRRLWGQHGSGQGRQPHLDDGHHHCPRRIEPESDCHRRLLL
ncbi:hypothetical protein ASF88_19965 [Leifsonia sp. Leaf336]|uniref:hypothetical protein n=1 Tax=Leifsonia sp. Leaf336 TaxID=1736341 RepID=UPI0006FEAEF1|nr:hypothetical protein [Leifsonia sp. Leaf336]KQR50500.1 hypothetical protein ASF88_19965 [Leifsonia sp. Leaf336]